MTPKEKAEELIDKYKPLCKDLKSVGILDGRAVYIDDDVLNNAAAKQCALIAINEIIDALETYDERTEKHLKREFPNYLSCELQNMEQDFRYYEQVKTEINKL